MWNLNLSMNLSYSFTLKSIILNFEQIFYLNDFVTSYTGHLQNIGFTNDAYFLNVVFILQYQKITFIVINFIRKVYQEAIKHKAEEMSFPKFQFLLQSLGFFIGCFFFVFFFVFVFLPILVLIDQINKYSQQLEVLLNILGGGSGMQIEGII